MSRKGDHEGVPGEPFSLRRWARRKQAANGRQVPAAGDASALRPVLGTPAAPTAVDAAAAGDAAAARAAHSGAAAGPTGSNLPPTTPAQPSDAKPLPAVETLSFDSDFTAFLSPRVEESVRRAALKKLFADPRFNVIDGLDVYLDDYSKFEPLPPDEVRELAHARALFDPAKTVVGEDGTVIEVPVARASEPGAEAIVSSDPSESGDAGTADGADVGAAAVADADADGRAAGSEPVSAAKGGAAANRASEGDPGADVADDATATSRRVSVAIGAKPLRPAPGS